MSVDATGEHIVKMIIILLRLVMLIVMPSGQQRDSGLELTRLLRFPPLCRVRSAAPGLREIAVGYVGREPPKAEPSQCVGRVPPKADPSGPEGVALWN